MTEIKSPNSAWEKIRKIVGTRTFQFLLGVALIVLVVFLLSRQIHPGEIEKAIRQANIWWVVAAFIVGVVAWLGAALPLKMLASIKVPYSHALLVQISASFVNVAVPGGLGTATLDLDYLKRRGMGTARAVAVVALVELTQVVGTLLLLGVALIFDHSFPKMNFPLKELLIVTVVVVLLLAASLAFKKVRSFVTDKVKEYWEKIRPELSRIRKNPLSAVWAVVGLVIETVLHAVALLFCLYAIGHPISLAEAIMVYLIGTTIGSAIPVPGGIGSTLAAMVATLHFIGVSASLATVGVVLFRFLTFYLLVPVGAIAFTYMQKRKLL